MKRFLPLAALAAALSIAVIGAAQSPTAPQPAGTPVPDVSPAPGNGGNPGSAASGVPLPAQNVPPAAEQQQTMPLIPENVTPGSGKKGKGGKSRKGPKSGQPGGAVSPGGSPHETFQVEEDIRMRIRMRKAETVAVNEPDIQADWVAAHETRTDPARREALKVYYNHLYDRMIKIDPTITVGANLRRQAVLGRLVYARLGDLLPSDNPYATPEPEAESQNPPASDVPPSL